MLRLAAFALLLSACVAATAGEVQVAAAANLGTTIQKIAAAFQRDTGHQAVVSLGATGRFYAQVRNGAPFEVLMAADEETPRKLEAEGLARSETHFIYALGQLVLWSPQTGGVDARGEVLRQPPRGKLAIADPRLAPYGVAAVEALRNLGLWETWQPMLVQGENITQAYQFVATGNAQLGLVALSQVAENGLIVRGSGWIVAPHLYSPIRQAAVLLNTGAGNPAAIAFMAYLRSSAVRSILRGAGYGI